MFEGLKPEVEALLNQAAADLPAAEADPGLLAAMTQAVSSMPLSSPAPAPRRTSVLRKLVTAKVAVLGGALVLSAGVASAATGTLPDQAQDAASSVANVVGLDIPKSDKKEHPENHGKDVSGVARDKSGEADGTTHGSVVCEVASEGKCKPSAEEDTSGDDTSADQRQDGSHRNENSVRTTTTTTVGDAGPASDEGKTRGNSGEHRP